jgi:large subunit ribosomal protein L20
MARVKSGLVTKHRHKKILKRAKGYFGSKHRLYKTAKEQLMHSGAYAYRDRRQNKRNFRKLWITRINAECRNNNISYSKFINGLNKAGIVINRKMLSELAINDPKTFSELVKQANDALNGKVKKTTVKKEETKKEVKKEKVVYSKMTVAELKKVAKEKNIENYSKMKKDELLKALK